MAQTGHRYIDVVIEILVIRYDKLGLDYVVVSQVRLNEGKELTLRETTVESESNQINV